MAGKLHSKRSIKIESKIFSINFDPASNGSRVFISEASKGSSFSLPIQFDSLLWIQTNMKLLLESSKGLKFFKQLRCAEYTLWIESRHNKRGYFAEVFRIDNNGKKGSSIIIPEGPKKEGWILFLNLIEDFPGSAFKAKPTASQRLSDPSTSFVEALKVNEKTVFNEGSKAGSFDCADGEGPQSIDWDRTIVLTRRLFHQNWSDIYSMLLKVVSSSSILNPFHPNRALLTCESKDHAQRLCSTKGWILLENMQVMFEAWNPVLHARMNLVPSFGGWLKVRNIPLHMWDSETFKKIGDLCGGFIEFSTMTTNLSELLEASIKVKSNYTGFIPAEVSIEDLDGNLFQVQITTHYMVRYLLKWMPKIHGSFSKEDEEAFVISGKLKGKVPALDPAVFFVEPSRPLKQKSPQARVKNFSEGSPARKLFASPQMIRQSEFVAAGKETNRGKEKVLMDGLSSTAADNRLQDRLNLVDPGQALLGRADLFALSGSGSNSINNISILP